MRGVDIECKKGGGDKGRAEEDDGGYREGVCDVLIVSCLCIVSPVDVLSFFENLSFNRCCNERALSTNFFLIPNVGGGEEETVAVDTNVCCIIV
jgi:hypothetical protein